MTTPAALVLSDVAASYPGRWREQPTEVLRSVTLEVQTGELLVVVGPSGAGKSTMLRGIAGLHPLDTGRVIVNGRDVTASAPGDRAISMVFQEPTLIPHLDVLGNIAFGLRGRGVSRDDAHARAREVAASLGIDDLLDRLPSALSGGERRRVELARALLRDPDLFLFDEALTRLDPAARHDARDLVRQVREQAGAAVLLVTHDHTEAMALADRVAVLIDGRIAQVAPPRDVYERPATPAVASFFGEIPMNVVDGSALGRAGQTVAFRAEHAAATVTNGARGLSGTVTATEDHATAGLLLVIQSTHGTVRVVAPSTECSTGDNVIVDVPDQHIHVFDASAAQT